MKQATRSKISKPASTEQVTFSDGMLVTAEDLDAAMHYPLAVVQVLLRSYFGCGIVCGLELSDPLAASSAGTGRAGGAAAPQGIPAGAGNPDCPPERGFVVKIDCGVALGCDGYPIELCEPVKLDLSPDPCAPPTQAETVKYIAIRRVTASGAPQRSCGCGPSAEDAGQQCSRLRDHVLIQAFDEEALPAGICRRERVSANAAPDEAESECACMKHCRHCDRCAEPWVLLGTVRLDDDGLVQGGINDANDGGGRDGGRLYVKPIACGCDAPAGSGMSQEMLNQWEERYKGLVDRIVWLEAKFGPNSPLPPNPPTENVPAPTQNEPLPSGPIHGTVGGVRGLPVDDIVIGEVDDRLNLDVVAPQDVATRAKRTAATKKSTGAAKPKT